MLQFALQWHSFLLYMAISPLCLAIQHLHPSIVILTFVPLLGLVYFEILAILLLYNILPDSLIEQWAFS